MYFGLYLGNTWPCNWNESEFSCMKEHKAWKRIGRRYGLKSTSLCAWQQENQQGYGVCWYNNIENDFKHFPHFPANTVINVLCKLIDFMKIWGTVGESNIAVITGEIMSKITRLSWGLFYWYSIQNSYWEMSGLLKIMFAWRNDYVVYPVTPVNILYNAALFLEFWSFGFLWVFKGELLKDKQISLLPKWNVWCSIWSTSFSEPQV